MPFFKLPVNTERVTSINASILCIVLVSVSLFVEPWLITGWMVAGNAVLFAGAMGSLLGLCDVMTKEFLGYEKMASALGWMGFISGIFRVFSGFIPGIDAVVPRKQSP